MEKRDTFTSHEGGVSPYELLSSYT